MITANIDNKQSEPATTYYEKKIGRTLYRVTSVYKGEIELTKTLEDLIINRVLFEENLRLSNG